MCTIPLFTKVVPVVGLSIVNVFAFICGGFHCAMDVKYNPIICIPTKPALEWLTQPIESECVFEYYFKISDSVVDPGW